MALLSNPDAIIRLTVNRFLSVRQGRMVTSGTTPDVGAALALDAGGRVKQKNNNLFEISGNTPGGSPFDLRIEVLPEEIYDAVGLIIKDPSGVYDGDDFWDDCRVDPGHPNRITVRHKGKNPTGAPITYELYVVIKTRNPAGPLSDYGLIDPMISNL